MIHILAKDAVTAYETAEKALLPRKEWCYITGIDHINRMPAGAQVWKVGDWDRGRRISLYNQALVSAHAHIVLI